MVHIFDELMLIRNDQVIISRSLFAFEKAVGGVQEKIHEVIEVTNVQTGFMKCLAYRSIDIETRSRRNNLIFRGFCGYRGENCFVLIRDFWGNHLDIDSSRVFIAIAQRLGRRKMSVLHQKRPIIVNFRDFCDVEMIMSHVKMLRNTEFSIDYDFPREIQEARSRIWPKYKQLKNQNPRSRVQIVYPAKLIQEGTVIHNEFPDWDQYMNQNIGINTDLIKKHLPQAKLYTSTSMEEEEEEQNMQINSPVLMNEFPNHHTLEQIHNFRLKQKIHNKQSNLIHSVTAHFRLGSVYLKP